MTVEATYIGEPTDNLHIDVEYFLHLKYEIKVSVDNKPDGCWIFADVSDDGFESKSSLSLAYSSLDAFFSDWRHVSKL